MNPSERKFKTVIRFDDPVVRDHRVHAVRIMPGVTFLDLFCRVARAAGFPEGAVEFRNIVFPEPIVVMEHYDRSLEIQLVPAGEHWEIVARSVRVKDGKPLHSADWGVNARAELHRVATPGATVFNIPDLIHEARQIREMDELYACLKSVDIQHFEFMKSLGRVFACNKGVLAELHLSPSATRYVGHFAMHPAFLDASTGVSFFANYAASRYGGHPFIPMFIERFRSVRALGEKCYVWVPYRDKPEEPGADLGRDEEICLFAENGEFAARFVNLTFKKIRSPESLHKIAGDAQQRETSAPSSTASVVAPNTALRTEPSDTPAPVEAASHQQVMDCLRQLVATALECDPASVDAKTGFYDLGLDSADLLGLAGRLEEIVGQSLYPTLLFEYPNIGDLAGYFVERYAEKFASTVTTSVTEKGSTTPSIGRSPEACHSVHLFHMDWIETPLPELSANSASGNGTQKPSTAAVLVFDNERNLAGQLRSAWASRNGSPRRIIRIRLAETFSREASDEFRARAGAVEDYERIIRTLAADGLTIAGVVHCWILEGCELTDDALTQQMSLGLHTIARLAQALLRQPHRTVTPMAICQMGTRGIHPALAAIDGFGACLRLEAPHLGCRVVAWDGASADERLSALVYQELSENPAANGIVRYENGRRFEWRPVPLDAVQSANPEENRQTALIREKGTFLITGGAGGLGLLLARYLAERYQARLILVGRSELSFDQKQQIEALQEFGGEAEYFSADVTDTQRMSEVFAAARKKYGGINGVFHTAGIVRDGLVLNLPDQATLNSILRPKVDGTMALHQITRQEPLDFFVLFSSLSALAGNAGQSFYAAANRFMDGFAAWRETERKAQRCHGATVSINWPLWAEGGMQVTSRTAERLAAETGMTPLETGAGWQALETILKQAWVNGVVVQGDQGKIDHLLRPALPPFTTLSRTRKADSEQCGAGASSSRDSIYRDEDIAIIGLSGRYPQSPDLEAFWQNLSEGRDCITEIPAERWDHSLYFDSNRETPGKCYSKWGGFLADVDKFDPLFFNISPRDAELMDPQERLFLQTVWTSLEDAGYSKSSLSSEQINRSVGVFVGVMWGGYQLYGAEELAQGNVVTANSPYWSIANRVSYYFDLTGPSFAVDSACSSSLMAIHLACESLRRGECRMAVAGGVNLSLHPSKYLLLSQMGMLSSHGRCKTFGAEGDGYVPGEGVGALILKPVRAALADGDTIHAIIKGSALNHDGRANGFTVPNPKAQTQVIEEALRKAAVHPRTISYIEAHGTGTALGDPIEITGLTRAFRTQTEDRGFCSIGSVKSTIGHLEAAAGVSAVTKVVLQFKHQKLCPSLHATVANPKIDFDNSPFVIQSQLTDWKRPRVPVGGESMECPRRAGVSSFGAGGANVHVVLEEPSATAGATSAKRVPPLLLLSAQNGERLRAVAERLLSCLAHCRPDFSDLLFTLQVGREPLEERLALVASDQEEAVRKLRAFLSKESDAALFVGKVQKKGISVRSEMADQAVAEWFSGAHQSLESARRMAQLWVEGHTIEWFSLSQGPVRRISLPVYPFEGKRFWLTRVQKNGVSGAALPPRNGEGALAAVAASESQKPSGTESTTQAKEEASLFKPVWIEFPSPRAAVPLGGTWAVLSSDQFFVDALKARLPGASVLWASFSETFGKLPNGALGIRANVAEDYRRWLSDGAVNGPSLSGVIIGDEDHSWSHGKLLDQQTLPQATVLDVLFHVSRTLTERSGKAPLRLIYACRETQGGNLMAGAASGFLRSLQRETPRLTASVMAAQLESSVDLAQAIVDELGETATDVRIRRHGRLVRQWSGIGSSEISSHSQSAVALKPQGVYLITGGAGGIGLQIAKHLGVQLGARLIVMGRTPLPETESWRLLLVTDRSLSPEARRRIEAFAEIEKAGGQVHYEAADVTQADSVRAALDRARRRFGNINGVIHCAGLTRDAFIGKKLLADFHAVIAPKLHGTLVLDQLTRQDHLDCFVLFSSLVAVIGNLGQCDYAAANAFMDAFAATRENWRARGERTGKTISINWPLWQVGGMRADELVEQSLIRQGLQALSTRAGMDLFTRALSLLTPQAVVWPGSPESFSALSSIAAGAGPSMAKPAGAEMRNEAVVSQNNRLAERLSTYLVTVLSEIIKINASEVNLDAEFSEYGVDSIALKEIIQKINRDLGDVLDPFVVVEKNSIRSLAAHLTELNVAIPGVSSSTSTEVASPRLTPEMNTSENPSTIEGTIEAKLSVAPAKGTRSRMESDNEEIAVIGMAGKFPGAEHLEAFWENLRSAKCSIREIPDGRWSIEKHFQAGDSLPGKSYSKWAGFVEGIDLFDPEFFGYSENTARVIDPLHRMFLEISVRALEDAGYRKNDLTDQVGGVFVGAKQGTYAETVGLGRLLEADAANAWRFNSACMIASRVAEFLDLRGPSYVVDTACSSSLVSVHMACESLRRGECDFAIAGGVEALVGANVFIHFSQSKSLSPDGTCRPFESSASGTVLGEGCGAVVLKPLSKAVRDGDQIYAVIRGSAMNNHGSSATAAAQIGTMKRVMENAYRAAQVTPNELGYLELHGEGSLLRDAVELRAVKEIWEAAGRKLFSCPIGSVKANIGHLLLASGIAGFIKTCLILSRGEIPPHVATAELAKYAGLDETPYGFERQGRAWTKPENGMRRTAGVNATGIAGTNCFVICSESPTPTASRALSPQSMNKRRFWIDDETARSIRQEASSSAALASAASGHGQTDRELVRLVLTELQRGSINVAEVKARLQKAPSTGGGDDRIFSSEARRTREILEQVKHGTISLGNARDELNALRLSRRANS